MKREREELNLIDDRSARACHRAYFLMREIALGGRVHARSIISAFIAQPLIMSI